MPITAIPLSFSSLLCKYERPCPDSDFKRGSGGPHTRPWRLPEPFPSTHQTPADKRSARWHNETHCSFQLCVKCDILCLLVSCVDTAASVCVYGCVCVCECVCEELTGQSEKKETPHSLDTGHRGQHQSPCKFLRSTVSTHKHTHTHINTHLTQAPPPS